MKTNRRNFFRTAGIIGTGMITSRLTSCSSNKEDVYLAHIQNATKTTHKQHFNMCNYAAPKLDTVRVGIIGLGRWGMHSLHRLKLIEGLEIKALCDKRMDIVNKAQKALEDFGLQPAEIYGGSEDIWKEMCLRDDLDLIYIVTPISLHTPMSLFAMEHDKHVGVEVPAATTIEDCWRLVETSERTKKHCMMLGNCCYDFFELLTLSMARHGFFGEIVHGEGAYIHSSGLRSSGPLPYSSRWRMLEFKNRIGNLYPTHGLGPICQIMNINRGDKMTYMSSMSSNDFMRKRWIEERAKEDEFFEQFVGIEQNGNMNTSMIKTAQGRTIILQFEITSPRVYSRIHMISGTKAFAQKYPLPGRISQGHTWVSEADMAALTKKYTPEIVSHMGEVAKKIGGHGGMDFLMIWRLIDCLRNGLPLDQDVYDAASWSSIGPLSEWSVANNSNSIKVPDFTCGSYKNNVPIDITLSQGGNTGVRTR